MMIFKKCVQVPLKGIVSTNCCRLFNTLQVHSSIGSSCRLTADWRHLRTTVWTVSVRTYAQAQKEQQHDSENRTGKELDVKRTNPYAGLSMGQKGTQLFLTHMLITQNVLKMERELQHLVRNIEHTRSCRSKVKFIFLRF